MKTSSQKFQQVRLLALDVDGVLTDGGVYLLEDGTQFRRFNIKDGLGLKQIMRTGLKVVLISSATAKSVCHRAEQLGIQDVYLGVQDKLARLREICKQGQLAMSDVCYMGDDLADLTVMQHVGLPCAPADAVLQIRRVAFYVTQASGGQGAVREICEILLESQGHSSSK